MNDYYVYRHINKKNGKQYIGITKQIPERRWGQNGNGYKSTPYFYNAIKKYGWDAFEHRIICSGLSKEYACKLEKELIKKYKTQNKLYGYNILEGGNAPIIPDEIKEKMSIAAKNRQKVFGRKCSDETKRKISDAQKGRHFTEEHRRAISEAKKGKTHKPISKEARDKIAEAHEKKQVFCKETNTVYPSIQECARQLNIKATTICRCCKGRLKSTHGYHFSYFNINNNT